MARLFDEIPHLESDRIVLKRLEHSDADALYELAHSDEVYRYLPTYLVEQQYEDMHHVIDLVNGPFVAQRQGILLGVHLKEDMSFCGLGELYGFRDEFHKISMGYRLLSRYWGRGIATEAVALLVDYLYSQTEIELITASTMIANQASASVLRKNGFIRTTSADEDWGYPEPTLADKWFR